MNPAAEYLVRLLVWLTNETLQAGLLIGVIWLLLLVLGRTMTPGWRHALWLVLIVRLLCPWAPTSRFSLYRLIPRLEPSTLEGWFPSSSLWLGTAIWFTGVLVLAIYILGYHWRLRRRVARERTIKSPVANDILDACCEQLEVKNKIRLQLTRHVQVPTLLGCLRPCLLIPRSMASFFSRRRLQHVFLHELAHHKRYDIGVRWLATLCQVVHWFNPLVWLAFYVMRSDCELACDRMALSCLEPTQPRQYGQTLIRLIEHVSYRHQLAMLAAGLAQDRFQLKKRLRTITGFRPFHGAARNWPVLLLVVLILTGLTDAQRQTTGRNARESNPEVADSVRNYYDLSRERPENGYLFDKFYEAWLKSDTGDHLESFLKTALDQNQAMADRLMLAFYYERQGRDGEALELYRQGALQDAVEADFLFHKARAETRQLEFTTAIADLLRARALPCSEELAEKAGKLLGELYIRTHQRDKAAELWQQLLAQGTDNEALYEDLIELQIKEGLFDEALRTSDALIAITQDPYQAVTRRLRQGDIYQYQANRPQALAVYAQALDEVGRGSWLENQIVAQIEELFLRADDREGLRDYLAELVTAHPQRIGLKKQLAQVLVQLGQADKALALYQEILRTTPGDKANLKAYVDILTEAGQRDKAITLLETLSQQRDQDREILLRLAELYHQDGQDTKVAPVLGQFLAQSDTTEYAYLRVAGLLEQYGLKDQAESFYQRMLAAFPESLSARQAYGEFLYQRKQTEAALALFQSVAERGDLQTMIRACNAAGTRGHYDRALAWAEARYDAFASDVSYLNHLCKLAIRLEQFDKAAHWARQQLELADAYPAIRTALAQVLTAVGSGEPVQRLWRELEARETLSVQQICLLCELYELEHRPDRTDTLLTQAAGLYPDIALREQIHIDRLRGNWARAAANLETLINKTGKREIDLIRDLVELYQEYERYEEAIKWVEVWQAVAPTSAAPRLLHAQLLGAQGRHEQALNLLDGAQREFEDNAEVLSQLANLYTITGKYEAARRIYWRLYEIAQSTADKLRTIQQLAEVAGKLGQQQELIDRLKRQQQQQHPSVVPLLALAEVYKQMGSYEEHRQALLEATHIQTDDVTLLLELARVEEAQGDWEKAIATLQRALALESTREARLKLARLCLQHGSREEGFRILSDMAEGGKLDPREAESIAGTILSMGQWESALHFLQGLLSFHPKDYPLHYQYAVALEEAGRSQEALEAFVDLLGFQDEIDGQPVKPTPFSWTRQGIDIQLQQILPKTSIDLLRANQFHDTAYRYRRERQTASRRGPVLPAGGAVAYVTVPASIHDLHHFTVSHILTLAADLEPAPRVQVKYDLDRHGVPNAELLLDVSERGWDNFNRTIEDLAGAYPQAKALQAVWILYRIEGVGCTLPEAERIFDLFETSHPRLALIVGLRCYGKDPIASRLFTRSLQMLRRVSDPGYYEAMAVAVTLQQKNSPVTLTKQQRDLLDDCLLEWYAKLNTMSSSRTFIFNYVASLLRQHKDSSAYVKLLDDEITHYTSPAVSTVAGRSFPGLIAALSYPPTTLPDFPDHVLQNLIHNAMVRGQLPSRTTGKASASWGRYLDYAQDPVLKILLAMVSGDIQTADTLIQGLLKNKPGSLTAYLLAASLAARRDRPLEVIALLDKARSLPMSASDRTRIDGALVASALELDPQTHPNERAIGEKAAVRLVSVPLDPWQREELIVAAEKLGLAEQAKNLKQQGPASLATRTRFSGQGLPSYVPGPGTEIIKEYFDKGQTDSALRLSLDSLRSVVQRSLQPEYDRYLSGSIQSLLDLIEQRRIADKLIEQADPGAQATAPQLTEFGRICELLDRNKKAVEAYKRALAKNPREAAAHVHLILLLAEIEPDRCADALVAVDKGCLPQVGSGLVSNVRRLLQRQDAEPALALVARIGEALDRIPDKTKLDLGWVDRLADVTADTYFSGRNPLMSLYRPQQNTVMYSMTGRGGSSSFQATWSLAPGQSQPIVQYQGSPGLKPVSANSPIAEKRCAVHNRLCRAMLEIPQLAEQGFSRLVAEAQARDALTEEFTQMARHALLTSSSTSASGSSTPPAYGTPLSKPPCPAEFLVQQAHYAGSLDKLVDEFVPQLEQQGQTEQAERVKRFADLYRSGSASPGPGWAQSSQNTQRMPSFNPQPATTRTTTPSSHDPNRIQQRQTLSREERGRRARDRRRANP